MIRITTVILNNFLCKRGKTKSLIVYSYAFRWKITAMFGSDNCSQRLISKLMSQSDFPLSRFTIRGLSFVFIDASFAKSKSTFWPQAVTYHTSVSHEEKKFKLDVTVSNMLPVYDINFNFLLTFS